TERLREQGFRSVVTSALLDRDVGGLVAAGFTSQHELHLLRHDLDEVPRERVATRRARSADHCGAVAVDAACFDDIWALDLPGLQEVLDATPRRRFRVVDADAVVRPAGDGDGPGGDHRHRAERVGAYAVT